MLPSPPGSSSVFSASRCWSGKPVELVDAQPKQEVGLIEPAEHVEPGALRGARDGAEIDVRRDVALAGLLQKIREAVCAA